MGLQLQKLFSALILTDFALEISVGVLSCCTIVPWNPGFIELIYLTMYWFKQQTFISPNSEGWEVQGQGAGFTLFRGYYTSLGIIAILYLVASVRASLPPLSLLSSPARTNKSFEADLVTVS